MSTILDSLKKSSDQRDDNQKSSIDNFNFGNSKSEKKKKSFLFIILLFLIAAAILYWGYNYLNLGELADTEKPTTVSTPIEKNQDNINQKTERIKMAEETSDKKDKPNSKEVKLKIKDIKEKRNNQRKKEKEQSLASLNRPRSNPIGTTKKDQKSLPTLSFPKDKKSNAQQKKPKKKQPRKTEVTKQDYQYIYQLPFTIRKDIPKLTLNIHVYDESSENRIAIINGERFLVDEMIEEQVLVKEIVQEGVVLEFNGQEFLVPKL